MVQDLINKNKIEVYLRPIISIKDKKIFAFEALTRAYDENDDFISPLYLFEQAHKEHLGEVLDCYVRKLALKKFKDYYEKDKSLLLFLNFESSIVDNEITDNFSYNVSHYNLNPSNIIIEIKEDGVKDNRSLVKFVKKYRDLGFVIAIDDFGTGYSSFDRLALVKPDIVKVDRSIIYNINKNFINSEILTAIANMCYKIGAMVLAEGVESKDEVLAILKKDIDIFQGFYFSKAKKNITDELNSTILKTINNIGDIYKSNIHKHIEKKQRLLENTQLITTKVIEILNSNKEDWITKIEDVVNYTDKLEAIYTIDMKKGIQKGDTIINSESRTFYNPTKDGHDHSLKEYFIIAKESRRGDYLSSKYISKASGNMCRTYSSKVEINNGKYIVCFDIIV